MLPKNCIPKKTRVNQNSSSSSNSKKKTSGVQTKDPNFFFITDEENYIRRNGEISKRARDNYQRAVNYINEWNHLMNEFLKRKRKDEKSNVKLEFSNSIKKLQFTNIPNFMAFFIAIFQTEDFNSNIIIPEQKSSFSQTSYHQEKDCSIGKQASRSKNSIVLPEIEEDMSDAENVAKFTRDIQESQYRNYPSRKQNTPPHTRNVNSSKSFIEKPCLNQKCSTRCSEDNILKIPPNIFGKENDCTAFLSKSVTNSQNSLKNHIPRKNQSFATLPTTSSSVFQQKRHLTGILSASGMIASEINARGTPLVVKNMFEAIQGPVAFPNRGNILKNISKNVSSSSSSVILSDEECKEINVEDINQNTNNFRETATFNFETYGDGLAGQRTPKSHPLKLNERDLHTKDRNLINSIGIFTEAGDLKLNAKKYLNKKEDVKKGIFRIPRVSQIHLSENYTKSCTSESIFSDVISLQSSDIRSDD
ncbi:hypothetical protein WA026_001392 [Henosepilachna vigintioctopunctata]|uniref:Uncharacterized protein n=1 Tax=Henosepilachna vigintioctopunctata TaxID=420089 RepID=A0AAW1UQ84_9CUCU